MDVGGSISAALDPVLVPLGFAAGQYGDSQSVYCGGHDELSDRFPALPQANAQERGLGCCIDLVVEHADDGLHVFVEEMPLWAALHDVGLHDEAMAVQRPSGAPLDEALRTLADTLRRLFRAAEA